MKNATTGSLSATLLTALLALAHGPGCKGRGHGVAARGIQGPAAGSRVAKVVFVGKKEACACTKRRMDASWKALSQALGKPPKVPVDQYFMDIDEEAVQNLQSQVRFMVVPAVYFLDAKNRVVTLLQGEITTDQVRDILSGKPKKKVAPRSRAERRNQGGAHE